ncbi:MAG: hypothetical protein IK008_06815 [Bacteroidales bacterium]|nr:hypothetical protein [Bacteroidales bacterium]
MSRLAKIGKAVLKTAGLLALLAVLVITISLAGPVYRFPDPKPFSGPDIFNPYASLDTTRGWKRAVLHTHTRVKPGWPVNECPYWPAHVDSVYRSLGYDIVTFSNHNELTSHPTDSALQVNVYEHGYNINKFHLLVFGSKKVIHWDPLLLFTTSQKQFCLNYLGKSADFIQMNHPYRTLGTSRGEMEKLSGYRILELDTSVSTENEYWDWALSAGHYSFGFASDDLHNPDDPARTAIRCGFIQTPSGRYEDLKAALLGGCYYAMRVPSGGDWSQKRAAVLPRVVDIGLEGDTIHVAFSEKADSIRVNGQDHATLKLVKDTDNCEYVMRLEDPYARITAFFPDGSVIYSNPFARYDASVGFVSQPPSVNIFLSVLYNLLLLGFASLLVWLAVKLFKR